MKIKTWGSEASEWKNQENKTRFPIEEGVYEFVITHIEDKLPKNIESKAGEMIAATFKIVGNCSEKGRNIFKYFCVNHENPKVANMAKSQLNKLYEAARLGLEEDSDKLEGRHIMAEVFETEAKGDYPAGNDISNFAVFEQVAIEFSDTEIPF